MQDKVEAILKARSPDNVQEFQVFLGLLNYYGRFQYNMSTILAPLHKLVCSGDVVMGIATTTEFPRREGTPSVTGSVGAL